MLLNGHQRSWLILDVDDPSVPLEASRNRIHQMEQNIPSAERTPEKIVKQLFDNIGNTIKSFSILIINDLRSE